MDSFINNRKLEKIRMELFKIKSLQKAMLSTECPIKRKWFENILLKQVDYTIALIDELYKSMQENNENNINREIAAEFKLSELSNFNGTGGKPAYVAVNGVVYDVSNEATWAGASHFGLIAGKDLSDQFNSCHGMTEVLSKLTKVGVLK